MIADTRIRSFLESVAAKTPTPGGGSVSAAAAGMGASLAIMAARYTEGPVSAGVAERLEGIKEEFVRLIDADAAAYDRVDAALGLPKEKPEEKARRKEALQSALREAAEVPLQAMRLAVRALEAVRDLGAVCNRHLASDLGSSAIMLEAGLLGCSLNVKANAISLADRAVAEELSREAGSLLGDGARFRGETMDRVEKLFAR